MSTSLRTQRIAHAVSIKKQQEWLEPIRFYVKSGFADTEVSLAHFDKALAELESTLALHNRTYLE